MAASPSFGSARSPVTPLSRSFWVIAHRWAGLTIALFLCVVGITGAIIPWQGELQRVIAPERFVAAPTTGARQLPSLELRRIAEARTGGVVDDVPLDRSERDAASFGVAARPGAPDLDFDEIVLNPYDGREIARDRSAVLADGRAQLLPFLYQLHLSLALGGWGEWLLGIAALIWTVDCLVGFYLTLPLGGRAWWRHWTKSWRIRWRASGYRLNFDLHRAGGLWLWPMLFVFAWSSVAMNMRAIYDPVMGALTDYRVDPGLPSTAGAQRRLGFDEALPLARKIARQEAAARGLHVERERVIRYNVGSNSYSYAVRTERDRSDDGANSYFEFDAATGQLSGVSLPTGEHSGNTIDYWLGQLHVAGVFGLPYRIFVSIFGVMLTVLTVTGVVIWMKKRTARLLAKRGRDRRLTLGEVIVAAE